MRFNLKTRASEFLKLHIKRITWARRSGPESSIEGDRHDSPVSMMVDTGGRVPVILLIVSIAVAGGEVFAQRPTGCSVGDAGIHTTATGSVADSHGHAAGGGVASGGVASGGVAYVDAGSGAVASVQQAGKELHVTSLSPSTGWRTANGTVEGQVVRVDFANTTLEGRLGPQCDRIHWNNGVTWFRRYEDIRTVDVVFMTHLDVGFTNLARNVCDTYFTEHIPSETRGQNFPRARVPRADRQLHVPCNRQKQLRLPLPCATAPSRTLTLVSCTQATHGSSKSTWTTPCSVRTEDAHPRRWAR